MNPSGMAHKCNFTSNYKSVNIFPSGTMKVEVFLSVSLLSLSLGIWSETILIDNDTAEHVFMFTKAVCVQDFISCSPNCETLLKQCTYVLFCQ